MVLAHAAPVAHPFRRDPGAEHAAGSASHGFRHRAPVSDGNRPGPSRRLSCVSGPGAPSHCRSSRAAGGTAILTSTVMDSLLERLLTHDSIVMYYTCRKPRRQEELKLDGSAADGVKQLVQGQLQSPQSVAGLHERHKRPRARLSTKESDETLCSVAADLYRVLVADTTLNRASWTSRSRVTPKLRGLHGQPGKCLLGTSRCILGITACFIHVFVKASAGLLGMFPRTRKAV